MAPLRRSPQTSIGAPSSGATEPPRRAPTKRGTAPKEKRSLECNEFSRLAAYAVADENRNAPGADACHLPASQTSDNAFDDFTSDFGARFSAFGKGRAASLNAQSRPPPPWPSSSASTLRSCAIRHAHGSALTCTRVSSKRNARMMCCLLDLGLAVPEQRRLVVVLGEFLRLAAHLVALATGCGNDVKPCRRRPETGSRRPSEFGS